MWVRTGREGLIETNSATRIGIGMQSSQDVIRVQIAPAGGAAADLARDLTHNQALAVIDRLATELDALDLSAIAKAASEETESVEEAEPAA